MKALFCPELFQDFSSLKFDGLNIVNYEKHKDGVKGGFTLSYQVANHLAQESGLETVIFIPDDPPAEEIYGDINCNYSVLIPDKYNQSAPDQCYKTFMKMLSFASMKEPFVFLSCGALIKDKNLFLKNLHRVSSSNYSYMMSYRKCVPNLEHNKILAEFWKTILPNNIEFKNDDDYLSYDLSFFIANNISIVNEAAAEMCDLIANNKELIENIYSSQFKSAGGVGSGFSSLNPDFSYFVECILFPLLLKNKCREGSVELMCLNDVSVGVESQLGENFDPAEFNSHSISSFFMKSDIFNNWGVMMIDAIEYSAWLEIYYKYWKENNLNRIQL